MTQDRYQRGLDVLAKLDDNLVADKIAKLGDLGKFIVEFSYGEVMGRDVLSLRERELIIVALLTALGREPQLRVHMEGALNVGVTPQELEEVILQTVPYAGFPTAINAMNLLQALTAEAEKKP
ncbi:carboxymuconolactone decarboxylase family protein [Tumebacillus permanentifrigoris]|uniref:4-carboxymuconolactone decarboxylase n=1 Tax=Tumebacillus permanentifrigoris TaxID=378543 RepID=A0A316DB86_9BACL|nr:carboxymuconolactone decarboxylase family protein [Tumebacillus permanentifrigoris]PWK14846.1 4-carboxymuconolactone decarboxylase [Tumebacillus permanentifrigoris]